MNEWWKDPRLDDEGTYDYFAEELPEDNNSWSRYPCICDDCGKERRLTKTYTHYFYCWDGWDSVSYTTCWKCHLKSVIKSKISKIKKNILRSKRLNIRAHLAFNKFCKKYNIAREHRKDLWTQYYVVWIDKTQCKKILEVKI